MYGENERACPIINDCNLNIYKKYLDFAKKKSSIYFLGRQGCYCNCTMSEAVENALNLFEKTFNHTASDYLINQIIENC